MTVKQKQCLLTFLGYDTGGVDGIWGEKSRNAVEACQEDLGIPADGVWGDQTEAAVLEAVYTYDVDAPAAEPEVGGNPEMDAVFEGIRYWSPEEFRCRCGGRYCDGFPAIPSRTLLELVDDIRHDLGAPGHRSSGLRCTQHNANEGGVWNSRHLSGKALDFMIEGKSANEVYLRALSDPRTNYTYIIGNGPYVHVDVK